MLPFSCDTRSLSLSLLFLTHTAFPPLMAQRGWCVFIKFSTVSLRRNLTFLEGFGGACGVQCAITFHSIHRFVSDLFMIYHRHYRHLWMLWTLINNRKTANKQRMPTFNGECDLEFHSFLQSIMCADKQCVWFVKRNFQIKSHFVRAYSIPTRRYDLENNLSWIPCVFSRPFGCYRRPTHEHARNGFLWMKCWNHARWLPSFHSLCPVHPL